MALLLKAIPSQLRATLVATREITSTAILFRLLVTYQPGGTGEKQLLLKQLSEVNSQSKSTSDQLVNSLRVWRRAYQRAREIDTSLPDSVLLLKALETVTVRVAALDTQASYRLSSRQSSTTIGRENQLTWLFGSIVNV